jgi:two-component system, OmpR family, sensor histidine kinase BaeS
LVREGSNCPYRSIDVKHDTVYLAVCDTGAGLDADQLGLVFERFYRGNKSRSRDTGGSGLGLAIVKAHGGRVAAHCNGAGWGSTFALYLPQH